MTDPNRGVWHLQSLINTVLDISKIEAGQFKNLGEYALASMVETVMGATESLAATKKLCTVSNLPRSRMQRQPTHLEFGFRKSPVV